MSSIPVGIVAVDPAGAVWLQNGEASRILGLSLRATRGHRLADLLGPGHPAASLLEEVLRTQREVALHASPLRQHRGAELTVDLAAAPVRSGDETEGAVLTLRDRTIGLELESRAEQRARAEEFGQLASGVAHEVRNPLSGIRGAAELLIGKLEGEAPALVRYAALIREETDRITRLLDDLGELTRGGDVHPRAVNLHQVLDGLLSLQSRAPEWGGIDLRREYDPSLPELDLDPDRMTQVFLNLARNAVQAMEGRGKLVVRTRFEGYARMGPGGRRTRNLVRVEFEDSGPGIPEEDLPHLFTPFFTRRKEGTGLGLSIAQHWTVRHGGHIAVSRGHGGGSLFRVLLPTGRAR